MSYEELINYYLVYGKLVEIKYGTSLKELAEQNKQTSDCHDSNIYLYDGIMLCARCKRECKPSIKEIK